MLEALRIIRELPVTKSCGSCVNWMEDRCFAFDAVPPADVQATGCHHWDFFKTGMPYSHE